MEIVNFSLSTNCFWLETVNLTFVRNHNRNQRQKKHLLGNAFASLFRWISQRTLNIVSFPSELCQSCPISGRLVSLFKLSLFLALQECCCLSALRCFRDNFKNKFNTTETTQKRFYKSLNNSLTVSTTLSKTTNCDQYNLQQQWC